MHGMATEDDAKCITNAQQVANTAQIYTEMLPRKNYK